MTETQPAVPVADEKQPLATELERPAAVADSPDKAAASEDDHDTVLDDSAPLEQPRDAAATVAFLIPFPHVETWGKLKPSDKEKISPFALYAPLAPRLTKPTEGKEALLHKAQRKLQEEEEDAKGKDTWKAKGMRLISKGMSMTKSSGVEFLMRTPDKKSLKEIRILYPDDMPPDQLKADFTKFVSTTKKRSQKNSVIATALTPVALAFDTVTFIPGPFEIAATWSAASITSAARATGIANGLTNDSVGLGFISSSTLKYLTYRLHELCWHHSKKGLVGAPKWSGDGFPKRGAELAAIILDALKEQLGDHMDSVDTDKHRVAEDIEAMLEKAAKEYVKAVSP